ncbi:MAG: GNAT family N-acetyltransferase [Cellulosilyticaceae bacterium]
MEIKLLNDGTSTYKDRFIDLQKYCFQNCERSFIASQWDALSQDIGHAFGILDDEFLASSLTISNYTISFYGHLVSMGGIGGVSTASTYRSKGVCSKLLKHSLEYMNDQGIVFSALAPFMYEFYEKFGYKWCYNQAIYDLKIEHLKNFRSEGALLPIDTSNTCMLYQLYEKLILPYNGMCSRTPSMWEEKLVTDTYAVISQSAMGTPTGYMLYTINSDKLCFEVKEMITESYDALESFFAFIYAHNAQVHTVKLMCLPNTNILDILPHPRCDYHIQSGMMGRIINVQKALSYYPFKHAGAFVLKAIDSLCPWNNGCFKITINQAHEVLVEKIDTLPDFEIDIKDLSQLIFGFRTFDSLLNLGRIYLIDQDFTYFSYFNSQPHPIGLYDSF